MIPDIFEKSYKNLKELNPSIILLDDYKIKKIEEELKRDYPFHVYIRLGSL